MNVQSTTTIQRIEPATNSIRIIEWKTYKDNATGRLYTNSIEYSIRLYGKDGTEREYARKSTVDMMV